MTQEPSSGLGLAEVNGFSCRFSEREAFLPELRAVEGGAEIARRGSSCGDGTRVEASISRSRDALLRAFPEYLCATS